MDIPQQLSKKYGQAFNFGLLGPTSADVEVTVAGFPAFHTQAGAYVGPDAKAWIWFSPINAHPDLLQRFLTAQAVEIVIKGTLADGRGISAQRCTTAHVNVNGANGLISCTDGKMSVNLTATTVVTTLLVSSPLVIQSPQTGQLADVKVRYTLINALFCGESAKSSRRDRFTVQSVKYSWEIAWLAEFNKEQADDLKSGLVSFLPTATMEIPLDSITNPKEFDDEAEAITRLLTLATGIATTWVVREVRSGERSVQQWFEPRGLSTNAEGKSRYEAISNLTDVSALRIFLEETLSKFQKLESSLRLSEVMDYIEQARHQQVIQVRIAILVLCLELLSYQWCLRNGSTKDQLSDKNIVSKLKDLRKTFRFIEKRFTDDALRSDIRNPLIHSGQIPLMSFDELVKWADDLYVLALRILLCTLGYTGKFNDLTQGMNLVATPNMNGG